MRLRTGSHREWIGVFYFRALCLGERDILSLFVEVDARGHTDGFDALLFNQDIHLAQAGQVFVGVAESLVQFMLPLFQIRLK